MHRDLKPSNILVTEVDGKPVPKVIDFGLVKALGSSALLTDHTLNTGYGMLLGTPLYMAPEQMDAGALDIDTRADIYSLGVILYELLTGSTPFDRQKFKNAALDEIKRIVREEEPLKPSSRLSSIETLPSVAATRQSEPVSLHRLVRGELDWIVMKSLEKDRNRRYDTANALSTDVQRYLTGEPVTAAPPGAAYRIRKFVQKNRGFVVAATLILLAMLVIGLGWTLLISIRARDGLIAAKAMAEHSALAAKIASEAAVESQHLAEELAGKEKAERQRAEYQAKLAEENQAEVIRQQSIAVEAIAEQKESEANLARTNLLFANNLWNQGRVAEARQYLHRIPLEYRNIEWGLDNRLFEGSDISLYGHLGAVECVAFSPDGLRIVSGSSDCKVKLWCSSTGEELRTFEGHSLSDDGSEGILSIGFSPDGNRIVSGGADRSVRIWDVTTGRELANLQGHSQWVRSVSFSSDGRQIISGGATALGSNGEIKFWDALTYKPIAKSLDKLPYGITSAAFSPNNEKVLSVSDFGELRIWDYISGKPEYTFDYLPGHVLTSASFNPEGAMIVYSGEGGILAVHDISSQKTLGTSDERQTSYTDVKFSPDGRFVVSADTAGTFTVHNAINLSFVNRFLGHCGSVNCIAVSPDGTRVATASEDKSIKLWNWLRPSVSREFREHDSDILDLVFTDDGEYFTTCSSDRTIKLWESGSCKVLKAFIVCSDVVQSVDFSPDGRLIVFGTENGSLGTWDPLSGETTLVLKAHSTPVQKIRYMSDQNNILSVSTDGEIKTWSMSKGKEITESSIATHSQMRLDRFEHGLGAKVGSIFFDRHSCLIQLLHSDSVLQNLTENGEDTVLDEGLQNVRGVSFSNDGKLIAVDTGFCMEPDPFEGRVLVFDCASGRKQSTLVGYIEPPVGIGFGPDGSRIISLHRSESGTEVLRIWNSRTGECIRSYESEMNTIERNLASNRSDNDSRRSQNNKIHTEFVKVNPDGTFIVTGGRNGIIKIWEADRHSEMIILSGHYRPVRKTAFSDDGHSLFGNDSFSLLTTDESGHEIRWDLKSGQPVERIVNANFVANSHRTPDDRWLVVPFGNDVHLIDLCYKNLLKVRAFRQESARIEVDWHLEQAHSAEENENWFAATFHRAWILKARPDDLDAYDNLHLAHQELLKQDESNPHQLAPLLPPAVKEALALPRQTENSADAETSDQ